VLLLIDLDGVVYRGADPIQGVAAVLADRAARGDDIVYVTNNSMHYRADYVTRLTEMGAPVSADRVVSSARATALYLRDEAPEIRRVLVVGAGGLERELRDVGLEVVTSGHAATRVSQEAIDGFEAAGRPDAVVVGLDPQLTYLRLAVATDAIEASTGTTPLSIGKPAPLLLEEAAKAAGGEAKNAVMIGDSLVTDVAAAGAVGARSIFMLTGVTGRDELAALAEGDRPTAVAADAAELAAALDRLAAS
jgi:glycerol 3-phosphatase-2